MRQVLHLGRFCSWRLLLASVALLLLGCGSGIAERTVSDVTLLETSPSKLDTDEALAGLATAAPRKILWIERERDVYDPNLVARDLERIERFYRARGYYDVKVVAARVESVGGREVEIEMHVTPGPRITVRKAEFNPPLSTLPIDAGSEINRLRTLVAGDPFEESGLDRQKRDIETAMRERGFAYVTTRVYAKVDLNARAADVVSEIKLGRRARFGEIRIIGLKQIPESKVRAALDLKRGDPYSKSELDDAEAALADLEIFGRIDVAPDLSKPDVEDVPIIVTVQEDKLRKLTLGGGTQLDALKLEGHLRTGWEHKNFLGGARRFNVDGKIGADLFPTRLESAETLTTWTNTFLIADTAAKLQQPSIFGGRTNAFAEAKFSVRPVLYSLGEDVQYEKESVLGYARPSGKLALERDFVGQRISLESSYNLEARVPFFYQNAPTCDTQEQRDAEPRCGLQTVWVSYPELLAAFQTRPGDIFDDVARRDLQLRFENRLQIAGLKLGGTHYFGGSLSDVKVEPELVTVLPVWGKRSQPGQPVGNITIATRAKVGFILLPDYGGSLQTGQSTAVADQQKLLTRAFYSGGSTSNRGYAFKAISPHGPIGLLQPTSIDCTLPMNVDDDVCIRPLGGFTLWEASVELRFAALYPVILVGFIDASDVSRDIGSIGFQYPHLSAGPGVRYDSPVGLIRLDVGIRLPGLQAIGQSELPPEHGQQRPNLGFPGAIYLAFGDAFGGSF
ncbi:MAG TPA: POTRA domain-containing protein [Polyangiaceae bacterium]|nr:POTRA domain-containing protein [Polyangiaceae bacterium]